MIEILGIVLLVIALFMLLAGAIVSFAVAGSSIFVSEQRGWYGCGIFCLIAMVVVAAGLNYSLRSIGVTI